MTNEQAIEVLKSKIDTDTSYRWLETARMAINALKQKPCKDCVSRQAVDTLVDELARAISDERCCLSRGRSTATIMHDIIDLPSVTPQPKIGKWVGIEYDFDADGNPVYDVFECSLCGCEHKGESDTLTNYCPDCGCAMIGELE